MTEANQPLRKDKTTTAATGNQWSHSVIESRLAFVIFIVMQTALIAQIHCQQTGSQPVAKIY